MNTLKHIVLVFLGSLFVESVSCALYADNDGMRIEIYAPQWPDKLLKFVSYYDGERYTQDVVQLSNRGEGVLKSSLKYPEGLYMIHLDSLHFFDLLIADDQVFKLVVDTADFFTKNQVEGAEQTEAFLEYSRFLAERHKERITLTNTFYTLKADGKDVKEATMQMDSLNKRVISFQEAFFNKHDGQWVASFFKGLIPVETGPYPSPQNFEQRYIERQYQKSHFFDHIDLRDKRFWYTNYLPDKVDQYLNAIVEQTPDTIARMASWLVSQALGDSLCARMMLGRVMNVALSSDRMGMENVWARLAEDYYFKELIYSPDSTFMARLKSEYRNIRYNRIGMVAQNLILQDSLGAKIQLFDLPGKLKLVYFFEPDCGFCKKITPRIYHEIYEKYKDKGLSSACICITTNRREWLDYLHRNHFDEWYNLWDPDRSSGFWQYYDTSTTPGIYVLDEKNEIIAKKLDVDSLEQLFSIILK